MFTRDIRVLEDSLQLIEAITGSVIFVIGLLIFAVLLISAVQKYYTNRSYAVGAIVILCFYGLPPLLRASYPFEAIDIITLSNVFFLWFGSIMSIALIFYFFMSCIRMLFEKVL